VDRTGVQPKACPFASPAAAGECRADSPDAVCWRENADCSMIDGKRLRKAEKSGFLRTFPFTQAFPIPYDELANAGETREKRTFWENQTV